ncbi:MAG: hypothetical protein QGF68_13265, partial [Nitrospinota bacterium]|nr:hypothetical protein [Nitrospinota bacterium]
SFFVKIFVNFFFSRIDYEKFQRLVQEQEEDGTCRSLEIIFGSVTEIPFRVPGVPEMAAGRRLDDALIHEIAEHCFARVDPMEDSRGSAWYKKELARVFARRIVKRAIGENGTA